MTMDTQYLFAYGILMFEPNSKPAILHDYARYYGPSVQHRMPHAFIIEKQGSKVDGALITTSLKVIEGVYDRVEGVMFGLYKRVRVTVECDGRQVSCWAYLPGLLWGDIQIPPDAEEAPAPKLETFDDVL